MKMVYPPKYKYKTMDILTECLELVFASTYGNTKKTNITACARVLNISVQTYYKIRDGDDTWPWWPTVFLGILEFVLPHTAYWKRQKIAILLRDLPYWDIRPIELACDTRDWLYDQLAQGPAVVSELLAPANRGPYSERKIRTIARAMGVIVKREGKGKDHLSTWELPRTEE